MSLSHKQIKLINEQQLAAEVWQWLAGCNFNSGLLAVTTGVSRRTAQRWIKARSIPRRYAVLIEQIHNGKILRLAAHRGTAALRPGTRLPRSD